MSVGIAAAIAFVGNLGSGIEEAKTAYNDTLNAGLDIMDEKKAAREERKNKVSQANIEQIKQETADEDKAKTDAKEKESKDKALPEAIQYNGGSMSSIEDYNKLQKDKEDAAKEKNKRDRKDAIDNASDSALSAKDKLDALKNKDAVNNISSDQLRRIGGGFAKSNYSGVSKEELRMNKAVEIAQKQYDELKKIVDSLKSKPQTDGITS